MQYHKSVTRIERKDAGFTIYFADSVTCEADKILIACGGFPKEEQYKWLKEIGHTIEKPVPSLFTFNLPKHPITRLMGVAVPDVTMKITKSKIIERGPLLITHWGLSGPVTLRTSAWGARELNERDYNFNVQINWLSTVNQQELKEKISDIRQHAGKQLVVQKNLFNLPKRLWEFLLEECKITPNCRWGDLPVLHQNKLIEHLTQHTFTVSGKTTFKEEFVTCGGVSLSNINPKTMESKIIQGLYFAGEIMDVDGITGGFNFQHAWASGYLAAQSIANS